jgi:hypothetical protein
MVEPKLLQLTTESVWHCPNFAIPATEATDANRPKDRREIAEPMLTKVNADKLLPNFANDLQLNALPN